MSSTATPPACIPHAYTDPCGAAGSARARTPRQSPFRVAPASVVTKMVTGSRVCQRVFASFSRSIEKTGVGPHRTRMAHLCFGTGIQRRLNQGRQPLPVTFAGSPHSITANEIAWMRPGNQFVSVLLFISTAGGASQLATSRLSSLPSLASPCFGREVLNPPPIRLPDRRGRGGITSQIVSAHFSVPHPPARRSIALPHPLSSARLPGLVIQSCPMQKNAGASPSGSPRASHLGMSPVSTVVLVLSCRSKERAISVPLYPRAVNAGGGQWVPDRSGNDLPAQCMSLSNLFQSASSWRG